jgi:hypothetical protein
MNEHANDARPKAKPKKPLLKEKSKAKANTLTLTHTSRLIEAAGVRLCRGKYFFHFTHVTDFMVMEAPLGAEAKSEENFR